MDVERQLTPSKQPAQNAEEDADARKGEKKVEQEVSLQVDDTSLGRHSCNVNRKM